MVWALVPGGTLSVLRDWVPRLAQRGDVSILSLGPDRASLGVPTTSLGGRRSHPYRFPNALGYVARMAMAAVRSTRGGQATVLMPQDALATGAAAVIAALVGGARVAVMEHGSAAAVEADRFWRERAGSDSLSPVRVPLMRLMLWVMHRVVLRRMDLALLAGDHELATFRARGVGDDRLMRYGFGIDLERFHAPSDAERAEARRRWGVDEGGNVILSVGRLAPEKGVDDLIAAVAGLPSDLVARLLVAGDGPVRADLERAAARAGVTATFVGGLEPEHVASILHAADCFVYAALRGANTPFAVLEAMASGLPVVATTAPAVHRAMLADGRGVAIEPGDREAMRAGIIRFLRDRQGAARAGAAASQYVATHHSPGQVDVAVEALVRRLWPAS